MELAAYPLSRSRERARVRAIWVRLHKSFPHPTPAPSPASGRRENSCQMRVNESARSLRDRSHRPRIPRKRQPRVIASFHQQHQRIAEHFGFLRPHLARELAQASADFILVLVDDIAEPLVVLRNLDARIAERAAAAGLAAARFLHLAP